MKIDEEKGVLHLGWKGKLPLFSAFQHLDKIRLRGCPGDLLLLLLVLFLLIFYKYFPLRVISVKTLLM